MYKKNIIKIIILKYKKLNLLLFFLEYYLEILICFLPKNYWTWVYKEPFTQESST